MTTALYVPGTSETDTSKIIMSQQLVAGQTSANTDAIAAINGAYVTTIAGNSGAFTLSTGLANTVNALRVSLSTITASLGADAAISNSVYTDGPSIAQGTSGTWWASGTVTFTDTIGAAQMSAKLWDGTTVIASGRGVVTGANLPGVIALSGFLASPASNIRISCTSNSATSLFKFNSTGNSKDSTISAFRIA